MARPAPDAPKRDGEDRRRGETDSGRERLSCRDRHRRLVHRRPRRHRGAAGERALPRALRRNQPFPRVSRTASRSARKGPFRALRHLEIGNDPRARNRIPHPARKAHRSVRRERRTEADRRHNGSRGRRPPEDGNEGILDDLPDPAGRRREIQRPLPRRPFPLRGRRYPDRRDAWRRRGRAREIHEGRLAQRRRPLRGRADTCFTGRESRSRCSRRFIPSSPHSASGGSSSPGNRRANGNGALPGIARS